jgi:hypothetical protein
LDILIPIVFPDYLIAVPVPKKISVLPWFTFDDVVLPRRTERLPNLGHAGALLVNGRSGLTKYFEYGRYDKAGLGQVQGLSVPNGKVAEGKVLPGSLVPALRKISKEAGHGGRIEGVYISIEGKFEAMLTYAQSRQMTNMNPNRPPYDLMSNNCVTFTKSIAEVAGVETPWMLDPRPNSYIGEFRDDYPDLDFVPNTGRLVIEGLGEFQ